MVPLLWIALPLVSGSVVVVASPGFVVVVEVPGALLSLLCSFVFDAGPPPITPSNIRDWNKKYPITISATTMIAAAITLLRESELVVDVEVGAGIKISP